MGRIVDGLLAGAAGTAALDAATYLDMVVRGRPESSTPAQSVDRLARSLHAPLGSGTAAGNRRKGLGALLGYATGASVGVGYTLLAGDRRADALVLGGAALLAANGPLAVMRVTDPRRWSVSDWLADVLPHLAYGVVAAQTLRRLRR